MKTVLCVIVLGFNFIAASVWAECPQAFSQGAGKAPKKLRTSDFLTFINYANNPKNGPYLGSFPLDYIASHLQEAVRNADELGAILPLLSDEEVDFLSDFYSAEIYDQNGRKTLRELLRRSQSVMDEGQAIVRLLTFYDLPDQLRAKRDALLGESENGMTFPQWVLNSMSTHLARLEVQALGVRILGGFFEQSELVRNHFRALVITYEPYVRSPSAANRAQYELARKILGEVAVAAMQTAAEPGDHFVEIKANQMSFSKIFWFLDETMGTQIEPDYWSVLKPDDQPWLFEDDGRAFSELIRTPWAIFDRPRESIPGNLPVGNDFIEFTSFLKYRILEALPPQEFLQRMFLKYVSDPKLRSTLNEDRFLQIRKNFLSSDYRKVWQAFQKDTIPEEGIPTVALGALAVPFERLWALKALALMGPLPKDLQLRVDELLPVRSEFFQDEKIRILKQNFNGIDRGTHLDIAVLQSLAFSLGVNERNSGMYGEFSMKVLGTVTGKPISLASLQVPTATLEKKLDLAADILVLTKGPKAAREILWNWGNNLSDAFLHEYFVGKLIQRPPFKGNDPK